MTFHTSDFQLPRVAAIPHKTPLENRADLHGARILVTDDELDARRIVAIVLRAAGALVFTAQSKEEALELAQNNTFDALVSDLSMPGGDGFSLLEELRAQGHQMPAIALSALPWADVQARVQNAGFSLHLEKPIELSSLTAAVADVIEARRGAEG